MDSENDNGLNIQDPGIDRQQVLLYSLYVLFS